MKYVSYFMQFRCRWMERAYWCSKICSIVRFVTKNTIEEKILELQEEKKLRFERQMYFFLQLSRYIVTYVFGQKDSYHTELQSFWLQDSWWFFKGLSRAKKEGLESPALSLLLYVLSLQFDKLILYKVLRHLLLGCMYFDLSKNFFCCFCITFNTHLLLQ